MSKIVEIDKHEIATALKVCENNSNPSGRFGNGFGKPKPVNLSRIKLADFVNADSWFFFKALKLDPGFLKAEFSQWDESDDYQLACFVVRQIQVG